MLKDALAFLMQNGRPATIEKDGRTFMIQDYRPVHAPTPAAVHVQTLNSLVELVASNRDGLDLTTLFFLVKSPTEVQVLQRPVGTEFDRPTLYVATANLPKPDDEEDTMAAMKPSFGSFMGLEKFIIWVSSCFSAADDRDEVLNLVSGFNASQQQEVQDNGISQQITVRSGVADLARKNTKSTYTLAPYRSFMEAEQAKSPFVLRLREGGKAALFLADANAWEIVAMRNVQSALYMYLDEAGVKGIPVVM